MMGWTLCSGIGAPEMAAPFVDWRLAAEIEPFPRAVLQERFGYVPREDHNQGDPLLWDDMAALDLEAVQARGVPLPDLLVAGTPCQSFSVAGLRKGLSDDRGNLTLKFVEICHAIVAARPDGRLAVLWENVPGVLSDKGNAFGAFLGGLVGAVDALPCPADGRWPGEGMVQGPRARAAWAVLDAKYFGVAQRRRRVFVVVDFGGACDPAAVLLEPEGLRGNSPSCGEAREGVAADVAPSLVGSGRGVERIGETRGQDPVVALPDVAWALQERDAKGADSDTKEGHLIPVAHALRGEGFDASEDGTGRGTPLVPVHTNGNGQYAEGPGTLRAQGGDAGGGSEVLVPVAFDCLGTEVQCDASGVSPPLRSMGRNDSHQNAGGHAAVAFAFAENQQGADRTQDVSPALSKGGGKPGQGYPAVAIQERAVSDDLSQGPQGAGYRTDDVAYTLEARNKTQAVAFDLRGREDGAQIESIGETDSLRAADGGSSRSYVADAWAVRRLTPAECARLQGFPDDHTAITYRGKPAADGPQYKAYGNSMAVPCVRWILDRIKNSQPPT